MSGEPALLHGAVVTFISALHRLPTPWVVGYIVLETLLHFMGWVHNAVQHNTVLQSSSPVVFAHALAVRDKMNPSDL